MLRTSAIIVAGLVALGGAQAGTITPVNLTTQPISFCTGGSCTPSSVTTGTYLNKLFTAYLPAGETADGSGAVAPPTPSPTAQSVDLGSAANTASFDLIAQTGSTNNGDDMFGQSGISTTVVDLAGFTGTNYAAGVFNIDAIYTMIQENNTTATSAASTVTVTLQGSSTGASEDLSYTFTLTPGTDIRSINGNSTLNDTSTLAGSGPALASATDTSSTACTGSGCAVNIYNGSFGGIKNSTLYFLDVQELVLPTLTAFQGGYLDSVQITNNVTAGTSTMIFSGLSLDQTPEPGTTVLLGTGLGMLFLYGMRRRKALRG